MNDVGIKFYVDGVYNNILLDDIIYIKVTGKWCHFILQGSDPEIKISLKTVWEMIKEAGNGCEHHLMKAGTNLILNMDLVISADVKTNTIVLRRGNCSVVTPMEEKKPKKKLNAEVLKHVQAIENLKKQKQEKKYTDEEILSRDILVTAEHEATVEVRNYLRDRDAREVLGNNGLKKKLSGPIETLNNDNPMDAGHAYVDLGLPSGTLWATYNLGEYDKDSHSYYGWGELYENDSYDKNHYKGIGKYCTPKELDLKDDVAHKNWGGNWRMPTYKDFEELKEHCDLTWCSQPKGCLLKSRKNGNYLFLPAYGYKKGTERNELMGLMGAYWTSSGMRKDCGVSFQFKEDDFLKEGLGLHSNSKRENYLGLSVRPVMSKVSNSGPTKKKTVLIIKSFRFSDGTPFYTTPWNPEGWIVRSERLLASPERLMNHYKEICEEIKPDLIVSINSASFFCKQLKGYPRIFLNPDFLPSGDLKERTFIIKDSVPQELINEYRKVEKNSLMARGDEKCCVVYGQPDEDDMYELWHDPDYDMINSIKVDPWQSPRNWMNTFLYPLMEEMVK